MKRLTETSLFQQFSVEGICNLTEVTLKLMYDDFVRSVIDLCISPVGEVPVCVELQYTRQEFDILKRDIIIKWEEKKRTRRYLSAKVLRNNRFCFTVVR